MSNKLEDLNLLHELEISLKEMPTDQYILDMSDDVSSWLGRISALINLINDPRKEIEIYSINNSLMSNNPFQSIQALKRLKLLLHTTINELKLKTSDSSSRFIPQGEVFQYFAELQKIIKSAKEELFIVDPYIDFDFISEYLINTHKGITIKILTKRYINEILPAMKKFDAQYTTKTEIRSIDSIHDRYIFVDSCSCYSSGASFKDGATKSPTTINQITDVCDAMLDAYRKKWDSGKIHTL